MQLITHFNNLLLATTAHYSAAVSSPQTIKTETRVKEEQIPEKDNNQATSR